MRTTLPLLIAALAALAIDYAIAGLAARFTGVPKEFPPFTFLPILSGVVGGFLFAFLAYALIRSISGQPNRVFLFVAIGALALSFGLPLRLSFTRSKRFAGVTPAAQMILVLMHGVVATCAVVSLLRTRA